MKIAPLAVALAALAGTVALAVTSPSHALSAPVQASAAH